MNTIVCSGNHVSIVIDKDGATAIDSARPHISVHTKHKELYRKALTDANVTIAQLVEQGWTKE
jgi:hypothetical protein